MTRELDRIRYARHLLLPEIGEDGQRRLLAARVCVPSEVDAGAAEVAGEYLARAGVLVETAQPSSRSGHDVPLALPRDEAALLAVVRGPELIEAARALSGALAAVEAIKRVLGLGEPAQQPISALFAEEA